jgi:hypothetical protein
MINADIGNNELYLVQNNIKNRAEAYLGYFKKSDENKNELFYFTNLFYKYWKEVTNDQNNICKSQYGTCDLAPTSFKRNNELKKYENFVRDNCMYYVNKNYDELLKKCQTIHEQNKDLYKIQMIINDLNNKKKKTLLNIDFNNHTSNVLLKMDEEKKKTYDKESIKKVLKYLENIQYIKIIKDLPYLIYFYDTLQNEISNNLSLNDMTNLSLYDYIKSNNSKLKLNDFEKFKMIYNKNKTVCNIEMCFNDNMLEYGNNNLWGTIDEKILLINIINKDENQKGIYKMIENLAQKQNKIYVHNLKCEERTINLKKLMFHENNEEMEKIKINFFANHDESLEKDIPNIIKEGIEIEYDYDIIYEMINEKSLNNIFNLDLSELENNYFKDNLNVNNNINISEIEVKPLDKLHYPEEIHTLHKNIIYLETKETIQKAKIELQTEKKIKKTFSKINREILLNFIGYLNRVIKLIFNNMDKQELTIKDLLNTLKDETKLSETSNTLKDETNLSENLKVLKVKEIAAFSKIVKEKYFENDTIEYGNLTETQEELKPTFSSNIEKAIQNIKSNDNNDKIIKFLQKLSKKLLENSKKIEDGIKNDENLLDIIKIKKEEYEEYHELKDLIDLFLNEENMITCKQFSSLIKFLSKLIEILQFKKYHENEYTNKFYKEKVPLEYEKKQIILPNNEIIKSEIIFTKDFHIPSYEERDYSLKRIDTQLKEYNLKRIENEGKGNCLFISISQNYTKTCKYSDYKTLRKEIVENILENRKEYEENIKYLNNITIEEYCEKMKNEGEWGSHMELNSACQILKREIILISINKNDDLIQFSSISKKYGNSNLEKNEINELLEDLKTKNENPILIYYNENHFENIEYCESKDEIYFDSIKIYENFNLNDEIYFDKKNERIDLIDDTYFGNIKLYENTKIIKLKSNELKFEKEFKNMNQKNYEEFKLHIIENIELLNKYYNNNQEVLEFYFNYVDNEEFYTIENDEDYQENIYNNPKNEIIITIEFLKINEPFKFPNLIINYQKEKKVLTDIEFDIHKINPLQQLKYLCNEQNFNIKIYYHFGTVEKYQEIKSDDELIENIIFKFINKETNTLILKIDQINENEKIISKNIEINFNENKKLFFNMKFNNEKVYEQLYSIIYKSSTFIQEKKRSFDINISDENEKFLIQNNEDL